MIVMKEATEQLHQHGIHLTVKRGLWGYYLDDPTLAVQRSRYYPTTGPAFTRIEQDDAAFTYTGTWTDVTLGQASGGSHRRNNLAGSTAQLSFTGSWVSLGFVGYFRGGYAEIFIDGSSRGVVDLYRNLETPISFRYEGLTNGVHTLEVRVLGSGNPFSSQFHVQFDYVDYGDDSALPDGAFEQDDSRVLLSNGWRSNNYAGASGGTYIDGTNATAWFPFTGDSFSLQALAYSSAGQVQLFVDGRYLDTVDLFHPVFASSGVTRTFAYNGLGAGPHVLQVMAYQSAAAIDRFDAPGQAPFINPNPPQSGVTRLEADEPAVFAAENLPLFRTLAEQVAGPIELALVNRKLEEANSELARVSRSVLAKHQVNVPHGIDGCPLCKAVVDAKRAESR